MIALVRAGEEVQHRHSHRVEAGLIGRPVTVAALGQIQIRPGGGAVDERLPLRRGVGAECHHLVLAQRADHIEVDHADHAIERERCMLHEIAGTGEAALFAGEQREDDGAMARHVLQRVADDRGSGEDAGGA